MKRKVWNEKYKLNGVSNWNSKPKNWQENPVVAIPIHCLAFEHVENYKAWWKDLDPLGCYRIEY